MDSNYIIEKKSPNLEVKATFRFGSTAKYMSIAVFRTDYETNCAASTSVRFDMPTGGQSATAYICGTLCTSKINDFPIA
jgi:hypothetical protein